MKYLKKFEMYINAKGELKESNSLDKYVDALNKLGVARNIEEDEILTFDSKYEPVEREGITFTVDYPKRGLMSFSIFTKDDKVYMQITLQHKPIELKEPTEREIFDKLTLLVEGI